MTLFRLIRHARHARQDDVLAGRSLDAPLSLVGRDEAARVARQIGHPGIAGVFASPRRRAVETAQAIAAVARQSVEIAPEWDEMDFGAWSGATFAALAQDPRWREWNERRATARCPGGETMAEALERVLSGLRRLALLRPGHEVVVVSHAEPIRALALHCLGLSFNAFATFDIPTASALSVEWNGDGPRLVAERREASA